MTRVEATILRALFCAPLCGVFACRNLLAYDKYQIVSDTGDAGITPVGECVRNSDCAPLSVPVQLTATSEPEADVEQRTATICEKTTKTCVPLLSTDCQRVSGDYRNDDAIILGTLFSTSGAQASVNLARERSAIMAADEINSAGGIPGGATARQLRPLVLVSCDEADLMSAGSHLVDELHVPAIIGPNTSQDTLDLSNKLTIAAGTLVISPTAVAASVADLLDDDLTWQMVPNDMQRVSLMAQAINALEVQLRATRRTPGVKLALIYRDDALGQGTRFALNTLELNGKSLTHADNLATHVRIRPYDPGTLEMLSRASTDEMVAFAPDIIVLVGTAEAVTQVMVPLEQAWTAPNRPEYVLIESSKTPELITAVSGKPALRRRIRGTGTLPDMRSTLVHEAFVVSYTARYPGATTDLFGVASAYDATYAVADAIAALRGQRITGRALAPLLRTLSNGGTEVELERSQTLTAFRLLSEGMPVTIIGANAPLQWDQRGAVVGGTVELWCIADLYDKPTYESSGLTLDLATGVTAGQYTQCAPL
ncbi:MAG: ABC transporter substrate-binding protein [Polyangiales bacterium]